MHKVSATCPAKGVDRSSMCDFLLFTIPLGRDKLCLMWFNPILSVSTIQLPLLKGTVLKCKIKPYVLPQLVPILRDQQQNNCSTKILR